MRYFVSYAHIDKHQVKTLIIEVLRSAGHEPWFDHHLLPGQDWQVELLKRIQQCDAFVYAMTPESIESEWCLWELAEAAKAKKPIVPVLLRQTELPEPIKHIQYADFTKGSTPDEVAKLISGLQILSPNQVPQAPAIPTGIPSQAVNNIAELMRKDRLLPIFQIAYVGLGLTDYIPLDIENKTVTYRLASQHEFQDALDSIDSCAKTVFDHDQYERLSGLIKELIALYPSASSGFRQDPHDPFPPPILIVGDHIERFIMNLQNVLRGKSLAAFSIGKILLEWFRLPQEEDYSPASKANFLKALRTVTSDALALDNVTKLVAEAPDKDCLSGRREFIETLHDMVEQMLVSHDLQVP